MAHEDPISFSFPVISVSQPIGEFYVGSVDAKRLFEISYFDIRRIIEERPVETYLGIQRPLIKKRVEQIEQYVRTIDATFPTSIIIAVDERCAVVEPVKSAGIGELGIMTLSNFLDVEREDDRILYRQIAKVIDGQHRIGGLKTFDQGQFELNVTIFIGLDIASQAGIFGTVNLTQTKVSKSLVYDLFALSEVRSPQKSCHEIVVGLDANENSPFYKRIKRLGVVTKGRVGETLSQATFVDMLLPYISNNPGLDQDLAKRGKKLSRAEADETMRLIFRNMFIDKAQLKIADIIWNYFDAVRQKWPAAWASTGRGLILNRTNGFRGFMRFLKPAYLHFTTSEEVVSSEEFRKLLSKVKLKDDDFNTDNFKPGTSGEKALFEVLKEQTGVRDIE